MLKIQVNGKGMIPRGFGLAPRKEPFAADLTLIGTILNTKGLTVKFVNPETGKFQDLTKANVKKIWDRYANVREIKKDDKIPVLRPSTPEDKKQEHVKVDSVVPEEEKKEEVVEENKEAAPIKVEPVKPINSPKAPVNKNVNKKH